MWLIKDLMMGQLPWIIQVGPCDYYKKAAEGAKLVVVGVGKETGGRYKPGLSREAKSALRL